jgi:uncharacterized protein YgiM (DUF1202 family)
MSNRVADRALRLCAAAAVIAALAGCQTPPPQGQQRIATAAAPASGSSGETEDRTTHPPTAKTYTSIHSLNLRTGPNHRFTAKTVLPVGTVVTPNGFVSGGWWQVDTPNFGTGWVDSTGLKPNA